MHSKKLMEEVINLIMMSFHTLNSIFMSGGITDFIQLLSTALFILKGSPKPAFYDGILPSIGSEKLELFGEDGWRNIPADGKSFLPTDVFVVNNRLLVDPNLMEKFESSLKPNDYSGSPGFIGSFYQRRDASKSDDGYNYIETSIWKDKASFDLFKATDVTILDSSIVGKMKPTFYEGKLALVSQKGI